jgi:hypothetical protein
MYKDLVNEYLKPVFIYGILETLPFAGNYHFANSGVIERTAANANNVDPKELQKLSDYYKTRRAFYSGKVTEYIKSHNVRIRANSFPVRNAKTSQKSHNTTSEST